LPAAEAPAASISPPEIRQSLQVDGFVGAGEGNRTPDLRFTKSFRRPIEVQRCQRISADTRVLQGFRAFTRCECIASFLSLSRPQRALSAPSTSTLRCAKHSERLAVEGDGGRYSLHALRDLPWSRDRRFAQNCHPQVGQPTEEACEHTLSPTDGSEPLQARPHSSQSMPSRHVRADRPACRRARYVATVQASLSHSSPN
jgi:hypothetical protein